MQDTRFEYVTKEDLNQFAAEIARAMAGAHKGQDKQINALITAFNKLREELGNAQNATAAIVDEDRDLLNTVILHQKYIMEKLGALTPEGEWTDEFKQWCAAKIGLAAAIDAASQQEAN